MRISKYYFDCITDRGEVFLGYHALLGKSGLRLSYESFLRSCGGSLPERGESFLWPGRVGFENGSVRWEAGTLGVEGGWRGGMPPVECELYEGPGLRIAWHCLLPRGLAHVRFRDGRCVEGIGYVERLDLDLHCATLPFSALDWGRAHIEGHTLIWIRWRGGENRRWAWFDGEAVPVEFEGEPLSVIRFEGRAVELFCERPVEDRNPYLSAPRLVRLPLRRLLLAHEQKWLCRARLDQLAAGAAISEQVTWERTRC